MSVFEKWANYITEIASTESKHLNDFLGQNTDLGNVREAIIKNVLGRFLPSIYEIGSGEIIDHRGNRSKQIDIIIARNDFPALIIINFGFCKFEFYWNQIFINEVYFTSTSLAFPLVILRAELIDSTKEIF